MCNPLACAIDKSDVKFGAQSEPESESDSESEFEAEDEPSASSQSSDEGSAFDGSNASDDEGSGSDFDDDDDDSAEDWDEMERKAAKCMFPCMPYVTPDAHSVSVSSRQEGGGARCSSC